MSSYSKVVKVANGGASGRLKKGHAKNTTVAKVVETINPRSQLNNLIKQKKSTKRDRKEMDSNEIDSDEAIESDTDVDTENEVIDNNYFITRLLARQFRLEYQKNNSPDRKRSKSNNQIKSFMIRKDFTGLSDHFLTFKLDSIFNIFETDAWDLVLELYRNKVEHSTCLICKDLCINDWICCDNCNYWYHYECVKLSHYLRTKVDSKWCCNKSKIEPKLTCRH